MLERKNQWSFKLSINLSAIQIICAYVCAVMISMQCAFSCACIIFHRFYILRAMSVCGELFEWKMHKLKSKNLKSQAINLKRCDPIQSRNNIVNMWIWNEILFEIYFAFECIPKNNSNQWHGKVNYPFILNMYLYSKRFKAIQIV